MSAMLNLSQGTGRMSSQDKKQFYISARAYVFESVSILQVMKDLGVLSDENYDLFYDKFEQVSKMLLGMIRNVN